MNFETRMKQRMDALGIKAAQVAKEAGAGKGSVSQWVNGISKPSGTKLLELCRVLKCQPDWLVFGVDDPIDLPDFLRREADAPRIPMVSISQVHKWSEGRESEGARVGTYDAGVCGKDEFALRAEGDAMLNPHGFPSIPDGAVVIVNPTNTARNGSIVVACVGDAEATIKRLIIDGENRYLKPLNPDYRPTQIDDTCRVIGVVRRILLDLD